MYTKPRGDVQISPITPVQSRKAHTWWYFHILKIIFYQINKYNFFGDLKKIESHTPLFICAHLNFNMKYTHKCCRKKINVF